MSTWWEERVALVTEATDMIRVQTGCSYGEAIASLRERARSADTDLETAASAVVDMGKRLGYRDPSADAGRDASHLAGLEVIDCLDDLGLRVHHELTQQ
jgi:hypothetical protein